MSDYLQFTATIECLDVNRGGCRFGCNWQARRLYSLSVVTKIAFNSNQG